MTRAASSALLRSAILESLDDLAETIDGFTVRFNDLENRLDVIENHIAGIIDRFEPVDEKIEHVRDIVQVFDSALSTVSSDIEHVSTTVDQLQAEIPMWEEVVDDIRRRERQEQLFEARAAMGKVAFVRLK